MNDYSGKNWQQNNCPVKFKIDLNLKIWVEVAFSTLNYNKIQ